VTNARPEKEKEKEKEVKALKTGAAPPLDFPAELDTPTFRAKWAEWETERREQKRKPLTPRGAAAQLAELAKHGETAAIQAINRSIANGYQGLFPENTGTNGRTHTSIASKRREEKLSGEYASPIELPIDDYSAAVGVVGTPQPPVVGLSSPPR
jgi:hypothetical protein